MSQFSTKPVPTPSESKQESATMPFSVVLEVEVPIPFQALAQLVRSLDSSEIERVALSKLGWGSNQTITYYVLETIADALEALGNAD
jgi:hypothetical protein